MAKLPKTSKAFRIDSATLVRYEQLARTDNRTLNNLVETVLMWAEKDPDLLAKLKIGRKRMTLGAIMGEVDEMRKELVVGRSAGGSEVVGCRASDRAVVGGRTDEQMVVGCLASDGAVVGGRTDEQMVVGCPAADTASDAASAQPDNRQRTTDNRHSTTANQC